MHFAAVCQGKNDDGNDGGGGDIFWQNHVAQ